MLGDRWGTQTIVIFDHTVRRRTSKDAQVEDSGAKVPPAEVSSALTLFNRVETNVDDACVDSKPTSTRHIGLLSHVFACTLEKTPFSVSFAARLWLEFATFGDHWSDL
jgi:hypothetical protein